jgi:glycosyltransferase involved in cell wall biosynthesis
VKVAMILPGGVDRTGVERVIPSRLALIERVARVHELHVFALTQEPRPGRWTLLGAQVHNAGRRPVRVTALGQIVREHRRAPFDLIHGHWASCGALAGVAGKLLRRPALVHLTGGDVAAIPDIGWGRCMTAGGRADLRASSMLSAHRTIPSERLKEMAAARGVQTERLTLGVSLPDWPVRAPVRRDVDAEARLLFVGNLNRVKDPFTLVRAAAALRRRGVRFWLDVVGLDTLGGQVQRLAAELGLDGVVHFHGWKPQARMREWMEGADVLLVTSRHEGDPLVALEAAVAGVPTVGTAVGHLAEWAPDAAVTVPFADPEALADAVAALLKDEDRRLSIARAAQQHAVHHDADRGAARVLQIYDELTRKAPG